MNDTADAVLWMLVEVFGHRSHAGRCTEEEKVGVKMLRIDEPSLPFGSVDPADLKWTTHYYAGTSIFSMVPTTEEVVMRRAGVRRPPAITHDAGPDTIDQDDIDDGPDSPGG